MNKKVKFNALIQFSLPGNESWLLTRHAEEQNIDSLNLMAKKIISNFLKEWWEEIEVDMQKEKEE